MYIRERGMLQRALLRQMGKATVSSIDFLTGREALRCIAASENTAAKAPRAMLVFAHPDDESIAVGARLSWFSSSLFVHITDGAPRDGADARTHGFQNADEYRAARRSELSAAFELAPIPIENTMQLGIPDQQAAFHLPELAGKLSEQIERFRPDFLITHPYEGGHPDHDACGFAVHAAVRLSHCEGLPILEAPFYHAGRTGMETGCFLPGNPEPPSILCRLSDQEQARKREILRCFATQQDVLRHFSTTEELFRVAPSYSFTAPPHRGKLFYEGFNWGIDGEQFRQLASEAYSSLGLGDMQCR